LILAAADCGLTAVCCQILPCCYAKKPPEQGLALTMIEQMFSVANNCLNVEFCIRADVKN
jgi:hypothetical protein